MSSDHHGLISAAIIFVEIEHLQAEGKSCVIDALGRKMIEKGIPIVTRRRYVRIDDPFFS